jgi:hypothetical protein
LSIIGVGWNRRESVPETELRRQLSILSKVELDLRGHGEIGPIESEAPYVEQELMLGYSLWSFRERSEADSEGADTERTAALWYGQVMGEAGEPGYQVILIGNPQYLRGLPDEAIHGIPIGSSANDPVRGKAIEYIKQLAARASVEDSAAEVSTPELEDRSFAFTYSNLVTEIGSKINKAVDDGRLPEASFATRHFLARRVSFSRAGETFFGIPVYVATVERSDPG